MNTRQVLLLSLLCLLVTSCLTSPLPMLSPLISLLQDDAMMDMAGAMGDAAAAGAGAMDAADMTVMGKV